MLKFGTFDDARMGEDPGLIETPQSRRAKSLRKATLTSTLLAGISLPLCQLGLTPVANNSWWVRPRADVAQFRAKRIACGEGNILLAIVFILNWRLRASSDWTHVELIPHLCLSYLSQQDSVHNLDLLRALFLDTIAIGYNLGFTSPPKTRRGTTLSVTRPAQSILPIRASHILPLPPASKELP
jgi:hypothetical protein